MNFRGPLIVLALVTGLACAQSDPVIDIHGVVNEIGLNLGLAGAQVTLYEFVGPSRDKTLYATTVTDPHGEFRFHPERYGVYWVEVKKESYFASISIDGPLSQKPPAVETGTLISVSPTHPSLEVRLALMRPGELTGSVIDENDKPLPGMLVEITMAGLPAVSRSIVGTGPDGKFTAKMLMPGDYLLKVSPRGFQAMVPNFTEADLKVVDEDLQPVYWPGVPDERSATPLRVSPGAPSSSGAIRLRKTTSYRLHISIDGCRPNDLPHLTIVADGDPLMIQTGSTAQPFLAGFSQLPSCKDFLLRGLKPGSYVFSLSSAGGWAETRVEIGNKNLETTLILAPGVDVSGRIVPGEGVTLPSLDKIRIALAPSDQNAPGATASAPDAKGAFRAMNVRGLSHRVRVDGLGEKYYVKEVRIDGQAAPGGIGRLYQGSQLEIVIDDQPAALAGSVTDGEKPFSQPLVFAAKWPSLEVVRRPVTGDNDGQFQITGLEPGEYRVLAVQSTSLPDGQQIGETMLGRLWDGAAKVTLERGGSRSVALKLSDPLR